MNHPTGATTAELTLATGLSRSTTGKALTTLEASGLTTRERGRRTGTCRTPDRWYPAPRPSADRPTPKPASEEPDAPAEHTSSEAPRPIDNPEHVTPEPALATTHTEAGGRRRLAPGGLRQLVVDHLTAHPHDAFTATGISRAIEKSSGAIANSLVTLTKQLVTEQVTDKPRTYRLARPITRPSSTDT
ncbi:hypothetical protein [Streptomyces sp. BH055]|uniref:hypothetical protein n=1 Tax=Streptomyces sp. BH055 TaxID=3401173 RepID=UPI003BB60CAD